MSVDTKRARELAQRIDSDAFRLEHDAAVMLRALADEVERQARVIVETGTDALELLAQHDTIWIPLLEAAEKNAHMHVDSEPGDEPFPCGLCERIRAAREAVKP